MCYRTAVIQEAELLLEWQTFHDLCATVSCKVIPRRYVFHTAIKGLSLLPTISLHNCLLYTDTRTLIGWSRVSPTEECLCHKSLAKPRMDRPLHDQWVQGCTAIPVYTMLCTQESQLPPFATKDTTMNSLPPWWPRMQTTRGPTHSILGVIGAMHGNKEISCQWHLYCYLTHSSCKPLLHGQTSSMATGMCILYTAIPNVM